MAQDSPSEEITGFASVRMQANSYYSMSPVAKALGFRRFDAGRLDIRWLDRISRRDL